MKQSEFFSEEEIKDKENEKLSFKNVLEKELTQLVKAPEFLCDERLTEYLSKDIECFFVLPDLIRERIKKKDCIKKSELFITDFKIFLKFWDKFNFQVMHEITL